MRLSKLLGISWPVNQRMWRKLRIALGHRDGLYRLNEWLEGDDAFVGDNGRESTVAVLREKPPFWPACEDGGERVGFLTMAPVSTFTHTHVADFAQRRLAP